MVFRFLFAAAVALGLTWATEQSAGTWAPFEEWRKAVMSGNGTALEGLYLQRPAAHILVGKDQQSSVADESRYWTTLGARGITGVNPKVLSLETADGKAKLVLRIDARAGDKKIVASAAQLWVQQLDGWHIAISQRSDFGLDAPRTLPEPAKPNPSLYPPPAEAKPELQAAYAKAEKEHKRVLVIFGANWCYDCHVLDATFRSPAFRALVDGNYVVVHVNIGDEGQDNNDIAARFGVPLDHGVPNLAVIEPDGQQVVARQSDFTATSRIGPSDVRAFLDRWKPHKTT